MTWGGVADTDSLAKSKDDARGEKHRKLVNDAGREKGFKPTKNAGRGRHIRPPLTLQVMPQASEECGEGEGNSRGDLLVSVFSISEAGHLYQRSRGSLSTEQEIAGSEAGISASGARDRQQRTR